MNALIQGMTFHTVCLLKMMDGTVVSGESPIGKEAAYLDAMGKIAPTDYLGLKEQLG